MRAAPVALVLLSGCMASRAVAPLDAGQHGVTLSLGGPFVQFGGAPVPVPFTHLGYRYGIDGHTNVHAGLQVSTPLLVGVAAFDVGIARELLTAQGPRPRLMLEYTTTFAVGDASSGPAPGGFRFFQDLALVATWDLPAREGRRPHRIYLGADAFMGVGPSFGAVVTPFLGTELRASKTVGVQLELDWHAPFTRTTFVAPVWYGPGDQGVVGAKLALTFYVPPKRPKAVLRPRKARVADPEEAP